MALMFGASRPGEKGVVSYEIQNDTPSNPSKNGIIQIRLHTTQDKTARYEPSRYETAPSLLADGQESGRALRRGTGSKRR